MLKEIFNGKNSKEIMELFSDKGVEINQEESGQLTTVIENETVTIFKGDTIELKEGIVRIEKPNIYKLW